MTTALNENGGSKRLRFESLSETLQRTNIDVVHRVLAQSKLSKSFSGTSRALLESHFLSELQESKSLECARSFQRIYYLMFPLVQSLPELLHNKLKVIELLLTQLKLCEAIVVTTYVKLVSALARDLGDGFWEHFEEFFTTLSGRITLRSSKTQATHQLDPTEIRSVLECMAMLVKWNLSSILNQPNSVIRLYGPLLACELTPVRDLGAKMFATVARKLKPKEFKNHIQRTVRAFLNARTNGGNGKLAIDCQIDIRTYPVPEIEGMDSYYADYFEDLSCAIDGLASLTFSACKGVKGCLHSSGGEKITALLSMAVQIKSESTVGSNYSSSSEDTVAHFVTGVVTCEAIRRIFRHLHPSNVAELWIRLSVAADGLASLWAGESANTASSIELGTAFLIEILIFGVRHSKGRALSNFAVIETVSSTVIIKCFRLLEIYLKSNQQNGELTKQSSLTDRVLILLCYLWIRFPNSSTLLSLLSEKNILHLALRSNGMKGAPATLSELLLPVLNRMTVKTYLIEVLLESVVSPIKDNVCLNFDSVVRVLYSIKASCNPLTLHRDIEFILDQCHVHLTCITKYCLHFLFTGLIQPETLIDVECVQHCLATAAVKWLYEYVPQTPPVNILVSKELFERFDQTTTSLAQRSAVSPLAAHCLQFQNIFKTKEALENLLKFRFQALLNSAADPQSIANVWYLVNLADYYKHNFMVSMISQDDSTVTVFSILFSEELCLKLLDIVCTKLSTPSYWLRIGYLRILSHFAAPSLLDTAKTNDNLQRNISDSINVVSLCLEISKTPLQISTERELVLKLGNLEVIVRTGRLPNIYLRIVCSFCLSFLNTKFSAVWAPTISVVKAIVSSSETGEDIVWPLLLDCIDYVGRAECSLEEIYTENTKSDLNMNTVWAHLCKADDGRFELPTRVSKSPLFYCDYSHETGISDNENEQESALVPVDARADCHTVYSSLWRILEQCPSITLKRSRVIVPMFLRFLNRQYYSTFKDDADIAYLHFIGLLSDNESNTSFEVNGHDDNVPKDSILRKRLEMFLSVFVAVTSPKQLYKHQLLFNYFTTLLSSPDGTIASLAVNCMMNYKPSFLLPQKDCFKRLLNAKSLRDELVLVDVSPNSGSIDEKHRPDVIHLFIRLAYGRSTSKAGGNKAREQNLARRIAILAFFARLNTNELRYFLHLTIQGLLPKEKLVYLAKQSSISGREYSSAAILSEEWMDLVEQLVFNLHPDDLREVSWERVQGHLHLLEQAIRVMGFGLTANVGLVFKVLKTILDYCNSIKESNTNINYIDSNTAEDAVSTASTARVNNQSSRIRTLCVLRLSELVDQYHAVFNFVSVGDNFLESVIPLVAALPSSVGSSAKAPALLRLLHSLAIHKDTVELIIKNNCIVECIIICVASRTDPSVGTMIIEILTVLLEYNNGSTLLPYSQLIVNSFSRRLVGPDFDCSASEMKLSELKISPSGSIKLELALICRIAESIFTRTDCDIRIDADSVAALATILLGMLRTYTTSRKIRVEETWVVNILRIYKSLLVRVVDVKPHVAFVSRLFGPANYLQSLFNFQSVRSELSNVITAFSKHPSTSGCMEKTANAIYGLVSISNSVLGTRNFDTCIPIFQGLSSTQNLHDSDDDSSLISWSQLLGPEGNKTPRLATLCTAAIHECIRCLYDVEMTVRSAALASLKVLVDQLVLWYEFNDDSAAKNEGSWLDLIKSIIIPSIHSGLNQSADIMKKGFIQLLSHAVRKLGRISSIIPIEDISNFHLELSALQHDDPEQDFFENISHLQLHRRIRALTKLREKLSKDLVDGVVDLTITLPSVSTFVHVMLPLSYHPLFSEEFNKKDHLGYLQEAAAFLGAVAHHLPWSQYYGVLKHLLKQLNKFRADKEKITLNALCLVLDSFHFNLVGEKEVNGLAEPVLDRTISDSIEVMEINNSVPTISESHIDELENGENTIGETESDSELQQHALPLQCEEMNTESADQEDTGPTLNSFLHATASPENISLTIVNSILPWVKVFLLKDDRDHKGNKSKVVRTQVAVALTKLVKQLKPPVVSEQKKMGYFTNLVISVVGTLKSRDASARDAARDSLSKMVLTMGWTALHPVIFEVQHMLTEGFQRHICNYTVRNLLATVLIEYKPFVDAPIIPLQTLIEAEGLAKIQESMLDEVESRKPPLDTCLTLIMRCVMDDLIGDSRIDFAASEAGTNRSLIRESKGSKANDTLELCAKYLLFRPTYALLDPDRPMNYSSIHVITSPLLSVLKDCEDGSLIGRIGEALMRVALGLSRNSTVVPAELLLYLHSTLQPFVLKIAKDMLTRKQALGKLVKESAEATLNLDDLGADELFGKDFPSYMRDDSSDDGDDFALYSRGKGGKDNVTGYRANVWLPSERGMLSEQRAVIEERNREAAARVQVLDGVSAPKLTGHNRHQRSRGGGSSSGEYAGGGTDPAALAAVKFCLSLLQTFIKSDRIKSDDESTQSMLVPFLPLLSHCLCLQDASSVATIALRSFCALLNWGVPFCSQLPRIAGNQMLKLMFKGGGLLTTDSELAQACLKGLCALFQSRLKSNEFSYELPSPDLVPGSIVDMSESVKQKDVAKRKYGNTGSQGEMPLKPYNLRLLLQLLTASITEVTSTHQGAAFQLVRVLVQSRVMLPELYDLIDRLMDLIVLSHVRGVREAASTTVVTFLLKYPLGRKRFQAHIKKMVANCGFEYEEGRQAALTALSHLLRLLPLSILEESAHTIFLPMTLYAINDSSSNCRESACEVLLQLSRRVSAELFATLVDYSWQWLEAGVNHNSQAFGLVRAGACVGSVLTSARPDLMKKSGRVRRYVIFATATLRGFLQNENAQIPDEIAICLMLLLEKLYHVVPSLADAAICDVSRRSSIDEQLEVVIENHPLETIQELLLHKSSEVQTRACRILELYLGRRNPSKLLTSHVELLATPNALYQISRRLCLVLNRPTLSESLLCSSVMCLCFAIKALLLHPYLTTTTHSMESNFSDDDVNSVKQEELNSLEGDDSDDDDNDNQVGYEIDDNNDIADDYEGRVDGENLIGKSEIRDGANWVMQRLRGIGADSRGYRRLHILKVFEALVNDTASVDSNVDFLERHVTQIVEVCFRARRFLHGPDQEAVKQANETATLLLASLERLVKPSLLMAACSDVQKSLDRNRTERKTRRKSELVQNPKLYAMRKIAKSKKKTEARKRKNERHSALRGMKRHRS